MNEMLDAVRERLERQTGCFNGFPHPLLKISETYPGLWLEHVYDSVLLARMDQSKIYLAENALRVFFENQRDDGQLPFCVIGASEPEGKLRLGYSQIQECVSIGSLAYAVYEMNKSRDFLNMAYKGVKRWVQWLEGNRMTRNTGLIEMFVGFDTGHDNSARVLDISCPGNYTVEGKRMNAAVLPPEDNITPILAVDMNANYYGNLTALDKMARVLGESGEEYGKKAENVKKALFKECFDKEDCFFYDVDKNGNKRKILSSTVFNLFIEEVLDKEKDKALINELCTRYIFNEKHFYTAYPFPAVSVSDKTWKKHTESNCWGYFTEGLTVLRCTLWMEKYGFLKELEQVMKAWSNAWEKHYGKVFFGQELDPQTGEPSPCSQWYSSCMIAYLYTKRRWE
jgi:hypothetical protein